jgi:hypothetical protein
MLPLPTAGICAQSPNIPIMRCNNIIGNVAVIGCYGKSCRHPFVALLLSRLLFSARREGAVKRLVDVPVVANLGRRSAITLCMVEPIEKSSWYMRVGIITNVAIISRITIDLLS